MKARDLRARIALAIAAGGTLAATSIVGCGSETETPAPATSDAGDAAFATDGSSTADVVDSSQANDANSSNDSASDPDVLPTPRRPFLVGAKLRSAEAMVAPPSWSARAIGALDDVALDAATRDLLARAWLDDALQEHASVAAFARFTMMLLAVGAPPELVAASQQASLDEIAHARDCFALARRYGARATEPAALGIDGALGDALGDALLRVVVRLAVEEGCVGETLGAAIAEEQLRVATDPEVRRVLTRIAHDEARHAELAWKFVAWACARQPSLAAEGGAALERGIRATRALPVRPLPIDETVWRAHGRLPCVEARAAAERAIADVLMPSIERLAA